MDRIDYTDFTDDTKKWINEYEHCTDYTNVYVFDIEQFNLEFDDIPKQ